jgi:hypothetical protein
MTSGIWYGESFISLLATPVGAAIGLLALAVVGSGGIQIYDSFT